MASKHGIKEYACQNPAPRPEGEVSDALKQAWLERTGRNLTFTELYLIYHVHRTITELKYLLVRTDSPDQAIVAEWDQAGYIRHGADRFRVTREFYDAIYHVIWVAHEEYDQYMMKSNAKEKSNV
jgi:hypothetical protein